MKIAFIILPLFLFVACNKPSKNTSIDQSNNQNDTIVTKTYWNDKKERLAQVEKVWKIDTLFVQDTTSKEIYPMPFRHGETHFFDSLGKIISINKIQFKLKPNYIILGKTSFKSDSLVPFNIP